MILFCRSKVVELHIHQPIYLLSTTMPPINDSDIVHYRQERIEFLQKKLRGNITEKDKENYAKALELYQKGILPGPKGKYHFTYIQDGKVCDLDDLRPGPYLTEVRITEIIILSLFC